MSPKQARRPAKATVVGLALALPLLAGCAYDDGYYGPPPDYGYGYGYGYYGYGGYPCSWRYDCDGWGHRRHHHRHDADDDDDGHHHGGDDGAGNPPPANPGGHASDTPRRPIFVDPPDGGPSGWPRMDRRSAPPNQIWIPQTRDSRR